MRRLPSLSQLSPADVRQYQAELRKLLSEMHPEADFRDGVLHDLVLHLHAAVWAAFAAGVRDWRREQSLTWMLEEPERADPAALDELLANFGMRRRRASPASGPITVVLNQPLPLVVAVVDRFEARGKLFAPPRSFSIKLDPEHVVGEEDRLLVSLPGGQYAFTIPVVALEPGQQSKLRQSDPVRPLSPPQGFVRAYAAADFEGGRSDESNADLLQRWRLNLVDKAHSGRISMAAWLRQQDLPEPIVAQSIVGFGDPEMRRDRHAIWPGSVGGRIDWYVRTRALPVSFSAEATATLQARGPDGGVWRLSLTRDVLPACYEVSLAHPRGAARNTRILTQRRGYDASPLADDGWAPDIQSASEAAFSPYQTLLLEALDPGTDPSLEVGAQQAWTVRGLAMPDLVQLQQLATDAGVRPVGADLLLRAPVPCFVSVSATLELTAQHPEIDVPLAQQRTAEAIQALSFTDRLSASAVINPLQEMLQPPSAVVAVDLLGRLLGPDDQVYHLYGRDGLSLPFLPEKGISFRTVCWFCDPRNVAISIVRRTQAGALVL